MENTQQLDQETLQNLLGNSSNLIPESLAGIITISLIASSVLIFVFVIFFIISTIRRWKVQSAVLKMQEDVADIKQALERPTSSSSEAPRQGESRNVEVTTIG